MPQEKAKQLYQFLIYSVIFGLKKVPIVGAAVEFAADWQNNVKIQLNQQANLKVQERLAQIEQAMLCLPDEVRKMALEMIAEQRRLGVDISPEQEEAVVDLASAMPAAIRERTQATLRQARQHGTALHTVIPVGEQVSTQERAEFYQSLLPARRSAFRENDWLPHRNPPWQLVQLLGAGGFGEVWEARHPQLNDRFAVKFCQDEGSAKVLKQEATALFRLRKELPEHPNIVRLWDLQLDKEPYWLAFEYVPGGTLEALMRGTSLTWQEVLAIFLPIVEGMSAVHKVGIVHRDLKPANILLTEAGVPKITDFGIGKVMAEQERTRLLLSKSLTVTGLGSASYASPEQRGGLPAHPADDTYALGVLLWQLMTHKLQAPQLVQRSLREINIPDAMKTLIVECWENPRAKRPQRAEDLLTVLQPLVPKTTLRKAEKVKVAQRKTEGKLPSPSGMKEEEKISARHEPEEIPGTGSAEVPVQPQSGKATTVKDKPQDAVKMTTRGNKQTLKELSPSNPLDWWRLLVWMLWSPQHLKVHRKMFGRVREQYVGSWLVSTLIWLPLFFSILGLVVASPPLAVEFLASDFDLQNINILSIIGLAWLLTGIFGMADKKNILGRGGLFVMLFLVMTSMMGSLLVASMMFGVALFISGSVVRCMVAGVAIIVATKVAVSVGASVAVGVAVSVTVYVALGIQKFVKDDLITTEVPLISYRLLSIILSPTIGVVIGIAVGMLVGVVTGVVVGTTISMLVYVAFRVWKAVKDYLITIDRLFIVARILTIVLAMVLAVGIVFGVVSSIESGKIPAMLAGVISPLVLGALIYVTLYLVFRRPKQVEDSLIPSRITFIILLLSHAFIFWYSLLGGWRFFA